MLDMPADPLTGRAHASDGDSLRLGQTRIRLLGLDAPELDQTCADAGGQPWTCGRAARDRLADLLSAGTVTCQPDGTDRYGRTLAQCRQAGTDLGLTLVAEGLAVASGDYEQAEQAARAAGLGIWQGGFERPRDWRDDHPRKSGLFGWGFGLF